MFVARSAEDIPSSVEADNNPGPSAGRRIPPKQHNTRQFAQSQMQFSPPQRRNTSTESRVQELISESLNEFRLELNATISTQIQNAFQTLNLNSNSQPNTQVPIRGPVRNIFTSNEHSSDLTPLVRYASDSRQNEKISSIIHNWHIKFSGGLNDLSVDEFIYRINTLTANHLNNDFEIISQHVHSLFEGKAKQWFWRFHRLNENFTWPSLCEALRKQYKEDYTDYDIKDDIRNRKQRTNETFDEFLDSILVLCDKLENQMSDAEFIETVIRNLKPDLRFELLHLKIVNISDLRREVRKHEKFMKDILGNSIARHIPNRKQIAEIFVSDSSDMADGEQETSSEVNAIDVHRLKCWNCEENGHGYHDCLKQRRVFCYGCGAKDTYKPNCLKCANKSENYNPDARKLKSGHPQVRPRN